MSGIGLGALPGRRGGSSGGFEVGFVDELDGQVWKPIDEVAAVAFERAPPVRAVPSYKGQRSYPGFYWSATTGAHVVFGSWFVRDAAMALDFDGDVAGFAARPFWLCWADTDRARSHAPDFFVRATGGAGMVVDCRPAERIRERDVEVFAATERACREVGWSYGLVTGHDPMWLENVRWLAGYRHPRCYRDALVTSLLEVFATARPLVEGTGRVGDPVAVLPTVFHLLWTGALQADLTTRLDATSMVGVAA